MTAPLVLRAGDARVAVDLAAGGRLSSLTVGGLELLGRGGPGPIGWGCFVMAPYAGRVRGDVVGFGGRRHRLPRADGRHALHGVTYDRPWAVVERRGAAEVTLHCAFDDRWPFGGSLRHRIVLGAHGIDLEIVVLADDQPFPATVGWHPWFRRQLEHGGPVEIDLRAAAMLARDATGVATRTRVDVPAGPYDDCFVDVDWPVSLTWPGAMHVDVWSDAAAVVVVDENPDAVGVAPQTGPPDEINTVPTVVEAGRPLVSQSGWRWGTG